jgi:thioredoxin reductase
MDYSTPLVDSEFEIVVTYSPISGREPATSLVRDQLQTDADGYIIAVPGTTQTYVRGVFAADDVQDKRYR